MQVLYIQCNYVIIINFVQNNCPLAGINILIEHCILSMGVAGSYSRIIMGMKHPINYNIGSRFIRILQVFIIVTCTVEPLNNNYFEHHLMTNFILIDKLVHWCVLILIFAPFWFPV